MFLLAPLLSLIAMAIGGIATVVATILNGPRRLRRRSEPPMVVLPPVPTPEMRRLLEERSEEPALAL